MTELLNWLQEPGKWNDAVLICGVLAVIVLGYLIKKDGKDFWKNF